MNKCPNCKLERTLKLTVDSYNTNFSENDPNYDEVTSFEIDNNLKIVNKDFPEGVFTYDKDRLIVCDECGCDSESLSMQEIVKSFRSKNPGWL